LADATKYFCGAVDGAIYDTAAKGARTVQLCRVSEDRCHEGSVTTVDCHPSHSDPRIAELVLTASASEASCRLWCGAASIANEAFTDVVHQVKWSPTHPAVFVTADASGRVSVWNLAVSSVAPVATATVRGRHGLPRTDASSHTAASAAALKLQWDDNGEHLICGTSNGEVVYFDVANAAGGITAADQSNLLSEWLCRIFADGS
jgi:dynein intermediate chain